MNPNSCPLQTKARTLSTRILLAAKGPLSRKIRYKNPLKSRLEPWTGETDLSLASCLLPGRLANNAFSFPPSLRHGTNAYAHRAASPHQVALGTQCFHRKTSQQQHENLGKTENNPKVRPRRLDKPGSTRRVEHHAQEIPDTGDNQHDPQTMLSDNSQTQKPTQGTVRSRGLSREGGTREPDSRLAAAWSWVGRGGGFQWARGPFWGTALS